MIPVVLLLSAFLLCIQTSSVTVNKLVLISRFSTLAKHSKHVIKHACIYLFTPFLQGLSSISKCFLSNSHTFIRQLRGSVSCSKILSHADWSSQELNNLCDFFTSMATFISSRTQGCFFSPIMVFPKVRIIHNILICQQLVNHKLLVNEHALSVKSTCCALHLGELIMKVQTNGLCQSGYVHLLYCLYWLPVSLDVPIALVD